MRLRTVQPLLSWMPSRSTVLLAAAMLASLSERIGAQVQSTATAPYYHFESGPVAPLAMTDDGGRLLSLNTANHRLEAWAIDGEPGKAELAFLGEVFTGLEPVAIALDPADSRIAYVANQLSDSVAVVDLDDLVVIGTVAVGDEPHDLAIAAGKLFVSCSHGRTGASVAATPDNVVVVWDLATPPDAPLLTTIAIHGHRPRALAVSGDGGTVWVAPQNSGNHTTVVPIPVLQGANIRQTDPSPGEQLTFNPLLTSDLWDRFDAFLRSLDDPPTGPDPDGDSFSLGIGFRIPRTSRIVDDATPGAARQLADEDVIAIDAATLAITGAATGVGGTLLALERRPGTQDELWVAGTTARNRTRFEPHLRGSSHDNFVVRVDGGGLTADAPMLLAPPLTIDEHAQPVALAFDSRAGHSTVFVAALGSSSVVALDAGGKQVTEVGTGALPMGLLFDERRGLLFVWCRGDQTIRALDVDGGLREVVVQPFAFNPEPPIVSEGRKTLYGATEASGRGSGNASCASCHVFGHQDQLAWDLGDPEGGISPYFSDQHFPPSIPRPLLDPGLAVIHPMKGPMMTQSLRGIIGDEPFHWRGDRRAFQAFKGAFKKLLGGSGISAEEMQSYATFVATMAQPPNPYQPKSRDYQPAAAAGREFFGEGDFEGQPYTTPADELRCDTCHHADFGRGNFLGSALFVNFDGFDQLFNPSLLRGIHEKNHPELTGFGSLHDGSLDGVRGFLEDPGFNLLHGADLDHVVEFVDQWDTGVAPIVGEQFQLSLATRAVADAWLDRAEAQASAGGCELIGKGWVTISGGRQSHGGLFAVSPNGGRAYHVDNTGWLTRDEIYGYVDASVAEVSFTCVLPGQGTRLGIDEDEDGLLDFVETAGYATDPRDPDSDDDGYSDGQEILALGGDPLIPDATLPDREAPTVLSHGALLGFVETATVFCVCSEPVIAKVIVTDPDGITVAVSAGEELRATHVLVVGGLPAGQQLRYEIVVHDRNDNEGRDGGSLQTFVPYLHVDDVTLRSTGTTNGQTTLLGRVRIVDHRGLPFAGIDVAVAWDHFTLPEEWFTFAATDADGWATFTRTVPAASAPRTITISPLALGSADSESPFYAGSESLGDARIFYEQPANAVNYTSVQLR